MLDEVLVKKNICGVDIWLSPEAPESSGAAKTLLLIQGSGRVRAGVWGCALCINAEEGLSKGTMLGYINRAHALGYRVIVANPNEAEDGGAHLVDIWTELNLGVQTPESVDVVAHSNGGRCFLGLLSHFVSSSLSDTSNPLKRHLDPIGKVACTDSYHSRRQVSEILSLSEGCDENSGCGEDSVKRILSEIRNYVPSSEPFSTEVTTWMSLKNNMTAESKAPMQCISAECDDHASTNYASEEAIFQWFAQEAPE